MQLPTNMSIVPRSSFILFYKTLETFIPIPISQQCSKIPCPKSNTRTITQGLTMLLNSSDCTTNNNKSLCLLSELDYIDQISTNNSNCILIERKELKTKYIRQRYLNDKNKITKEMDCLLGFLMPSFHLGGLI